MSTGFDPYHRWLSIPAADQPPTHYRILGLPPFESDLQVIENAALRQIAHVRSFLETPLRAYAVNLIHELSVARQCLIKSESKAAYDAWLQQRTPTPPVASSTPRPHFIESPAPKSALQASVRRRSTIATKQIAKSVPANRTELSSNDWIDATPVDNVPEDFWPSVQQNASPDFDFQPRLSIKRRRKKSPLATLFNLAMWVIGTAAGILAGYAILCIMDAKYDYLHLFNAQQPVDAISPGRGTSPSNPTVPEPPLTPKQKQPHDPARKPDPGNLRQIKPGNEKQKITQAPNPPLPPAVKQKYTVFSLPGNVPPHISLPIGAAEQESVPITTFLAGTDIGPIELSLIDGTNPERGSISLVASSADTDSKSWKVEWLSHPSESPEDQEPAPSYLGTFSIDNGALAFKWSAAPAAQAVISLHNSILRISGWGSERFIALRDPIAADPLSFDPNASRVHTICKCADAPTLDDIFVDLTLDSLPSFHPDGQEPNGLKIGDRVMLRYSDQEGATTQISINQIGPSISIHADSQFRLPSGIKDDLTTDAIARRANQLEDRLEKAKKAQQVQHMAVSDQISAIQVDIAALDKVSKLNANLNESAGIGFRLYYLVGGHPVDLMISQ